MSGHTSIPDVPLCLSTPSDIGGVVDAAISLLFSKAARNMPTATVSGIVRFLSAELHKRSLFQSQLRSQEDHKRYMPLWETSLPHCPEGEKESIVILDLVEYF